MSNEGLWQQVIKLDGHETARRAKCRYVVNPPRYIIKLLGSEYTVDLSEKKVFTLNPSGSGFAEELCILAYLINAKDLPLAGKTATAESLPAGQFFFRGLHRLPTDKLADAFGQQPQRLYKAIECLEAAKCDFHLRQGYGGQVGDASIQFNILPRVPLTVVIWRADEEFGARASILFDQTAAEQMPLDALWMAVNIAVKLLVKASSETD
jgi:hypothetical protein